ncbi:MAG: GntR family transcriptional regulator [Lachnospiraceae bacterium]|nr:GntR family transcriptional regulator [Candidatus Equihabitans merdae]
MIQLNYRDSKPIYEQIKDGLRRLMITGVMQPGEKLPSVREMASSLSINPNTIQRAYRELEAEGYTYSVAGKGSFVSGKQDISDGRTAELLKKFDEVARELMYVNETAASLAKRLADIESNL